MNASPEVEPVRRHWSLRARLLWLLGVATTGLWALAVATTYAHAKWQSERLFDESLRETAALILSMVEHEMAEHGVDYAGQLLDVADLADVHHLSFQIWGARRQLVYHSPDAPLTPLLGTRTVGYTTAGDSGAEFRAYVLWNAAHSLQIQIADPLSRRNAVLRAMLWRMVLAASVFLLLTLALIAWVVMRSFTPLQWISAEVAGRTDAQLRDVDHRQAPDEVAPLLTAINGLLGRVRAAVEHERRFTADAAHELRTPLAALRAHAQVLQGARTPEEAREATGDIITSVDRSGRLLEQLLALARIDQAHGQPPTRQTLHLHELIGHQLAEHHALAEQRRIHLDTNLAPVSLRGNATQLHILLRNLLDNALRYTPEGGRVRVSCGVTAEVPWLAVHDTGIGIPVAARERVFERFYRITSAQPGYPFGSGLGLSIVQRLAEAHDAQVSIESGLDGRGTGFVVRFRSASSASAD